MPPRACLPSIAGAALVMLLAGACTSGEGEPDARPTALTAPTGGEGIAVESRPHFEGALPVVLAAGQPALGTGGESCSDEDAPIWVCDPDQQDRYLVADGVDASLLEARMDVADGGTSWTVTFRFGDADRRDVLGVREEARGRGAVVLVLDERREVLASAAVPDVERGVIRLSGLTRSEAWAVVEAVIAT